MSRSSPGGERSAPAGAKKPGSKAPATGGAGATRRPTGSRLAVLVIYDIAHDGTRSKVADCCLDYGLDRIQFSAFVGELTRTHQEELLMRIKRRIGRHAAKVQVVTVAADDWAKRLVFEQEERTPAPAKGTGAGNPDPAAAPAGDAPGSAVAAQGAAISDPDPEKAA
jgi:CRISPR-associated protein Cas2